MPNVDSMKREELVRVYLAYSAHFSREGRKGSAQGGVRAGATGAGADREFRAAFETAFGTSDRSDSNINNSGELIIPSLFLPFLVICSIEVIDTFLI